MGIDSGPAWLSDAGGILAGRPAASDLGVNAFRVRDDFGTELTLLITVLDRLHINDGNLQTRTAPGRDYALESRVDLRAGRWNPTGATHRGDGSIWSVTYSTTGSSQQFFRVQISHR